MRGLGADGPYWQALNEGQLQLQCCSQCNTWHWPAVYRCAECGSWEQHWRPVDMQGEIFTWTRTWHDFGAPDELKAPYVSVLVALDGANHTRLLGVLAEQTDVAIGMQVTGKIRTVTHHGQKIPVIEWQALGDIQ